MTTPSWIWSGLYTTPTTKAEYDVIARDFFDLDISIQNNNRAAFVNLWTFIANRYKTNPYVIFSIMNEPLCLVSPDHDDSNIALGQSYSTYMTTIVDAIRSTGAQQLIFINRPYLWDSAWNWAVYQVNRDNIVWEDHAYVTAGTNLAAWESNINQYVQLFMVGFGKPLYIGEYAFNPMNVMHTSYPSTWQTILADMVAYMDSKQVAGRALYSWSHMYGEYLPFEGLTDNDNLTSAESNYIIQTVLG